MTQHKYYRLLRNTDYYDTGPFIGYYNTGFYSTLTFIRQDITAQRLSTTELMLHRILLQILLQHI